MTVAVTGALGNVGREVVRSLCAKGIAVRACVRAGTEQAASQLGPEVALATLDFHDPSTFAPALDGACALFLMRPPAIAQMKATLNPFIDVARRQGVTTIVFLSVAGAGSNRVVPHHAVEAHLASGPTDWTVLRPGFFAQNFGDAYLHDIVEDNRVYVPAGRGRVTFVDVRDVADVAADIFVDPAPHRAKAYTLTGPQAHSFEQSAAILSEALQRTITYEPASLVAYALHLRRRGLPAAQIAVQTILHAGLRFGQAETVDETLASLLGHSPRTLREYVFDHAATWRRSALLAPSTILR